MQRNLLEKLIKWKDKPSRKPLLLRGARQVGKTWLLNYFGKNFFPQMHYLNFEKDKNLNTLFSPSLDPKSVIKNYELVYNVSVNKQDLVIFDEVQESPSALTSLKYFGEEMPDLAVCAAGSHVGITRSSGSFPVGKVDDLLMYPLCFSEFLKCLYPELFLFLEEKNDFAPLPEAIHNKLWQTFLIYYVTGGLPEAVNEYLLAGSDLKEGFLKSRAVHEKLLFNYTSDFAKHAGAVNASHIHSVFDHIPQYISSTVDNSIQRFKFKDVIPGKSRFADLEAPVDWLINAGLVYRISVVEKCAIPLLHYRKPNIFKLTLFDTGLLHSMLQIPFSYILSQDYGTFKGYAAENFVTGVLNSVGLTPLYSWHGRQSEIEFVVQWNKHLIPLEVKSGSKIRAKSLSVFSETYNPPLKIIASAKNLALTSDKTLQIPLYLMDKLPEYLNKLLN